MNIAHNIIDDYLNWIFDKITIPDQPVYSPWNYTKLLTKLHDIPFRVKLARDQNRLEDAVSLRHRFGYECGYSSEEIANILDRKQPSVLEVMSAIAIRCEDHFMSDPDIGDRTGVWFWGMIRSLGIDKMDDHNFDLHEATNVISRLLDREYDKDGYGGLFWVPRCPTDLRKVEIWYQMCWYLNSLA